jgi:hypothetical protein
MDGPDVKAHLEKLLDTLRRVTEARGGVFKRGTDVDHYAIAALQFGNHTLNFSVGNVKTRFPAGYPRADPIAEGRLMKHKDEIASFVLFVEKQWLIECPGWNLQPLTDDLLSATLDDALAESPGPDR